jgi:hypothetical protein
MFKFKWRKPKKRDWRFYEFTTEDWRLIDKITDRVMALPCNHKWGLLEPWAFILHSYQLGYPIDLQRLFDADDRWFMSDMCGMLNHYDPVTKKYRDGFIPRYLIKE